MFKNGGFGMSKKTDYARWTSIMAKLENQIRKDEEIRKQYRENKKKERNK